MILLRVTADRTSTALVARERRVLGEVPDELNYWNPVCDLLLKRMERDGVVPGTQGDRAHMKGGGKDAEVPGSRSRAGFA